MCGVKWNTLVQSHRAKQGINIQRKMEVFFSFFFYIVHMYLFFLKIFRLNDNILIFLIVKYIGLMKIILIEKKKICLYLFFYKKNSRFLLTLIFSIIKIFIQLYSQYKLISNYNNFRFAIFKRFFNYHNSRKSLIFFEKLNLIFLIAKNLNKNYGMQNKCYFWFPFLFFFFSFFRQYKIKRSNFILFSPNSFELNTDANKRTANSHVWHTYFK